MPKTPRRRLSRPPVLSPSAFHVSRVFNPVCDTEVLNIVSPLEQRYHSSTSFQPIQIIRPSLHHFASLRKVLCEVVGCADRVALCMCKLALDDLMVPALFVQQRRRHAPKAVAGHLIFRLAHAPERRQYGVLAHEPLSRLRAPGNEKSCYSERRMPNRTARPQVRKSP
jgi:hypothetical protein